MAARLLLMFSCVQSTGKTQPNPVVDHMQPISDIFITVKLWQINLVLISPRFWIRSISDGFHIDHFDTKYPAEFSLSSATGQKSICFMFSKLYTSVNSWMTDTWHHHMMLTVVPTCLMGSIPAWWIHIWDCFHFHLL